MATKLKQASIAIRTNKGRDMSPKWDGSDEWDGDKFTAHFRRSMEWYRLESGVKELKPKLVEWMHSAGFDRTDINTIRKTKDKYFNGTMVGVAACLVKGMPEVHDGFNQGRDTGAWLRGEIEKVLRAGSDDLEEDEDAPKAEKPVVPVVNIQDRLREAAGEMSEELDAAIDSFITDPNAFDPKAFKILNLLRGKGAKAAEAPKGAVDQVAAAKPNPNPAPAFTLTSPVVKDGAALPTEFTGDGASASPPLAWTNLPKGTVSLALVMHHLDPEGKTKIYWLMTDIDPKTTSVAKNATDFGKMGMSTVHNRVEYAPPHSQGPGEKKYVLTLFALSAKPDLSKAESPLTAEPLLAAMKGKILAYDRDSGAPKAAPQRRPPAPCGFRDLPQEELERQAHEQGNGKGPDDIPF